MEHKDDSTNVSVYYSTLKIFTTLFKSSIEDEHSNTYQTVYTLAENNFKFVTTKNASE